MAPPAESTVPSTTGTGSAAKTIQVRAYRSDDHAIVAKLFKEGMLHYATEEIREILLQYVNKDLEKDLADIEATYITPGGNFWVATSIEDGEEVVVGMVGLERKEDGVGELRRMSVSSAYRRYGVGRVLVSTLEQWAAKNGFHKVCLGTGSHMLQAQKFYLSVGYTHVQTVPFPEHPGYSGLKFEKDLLA